MSAEEWRPIPSAPGYDVSDQGRVRSWRPWGKSPVPRLRKPEEVSDGRGYLQLRIQIDGKPTRRYVHQLVLAAFCGPCPEGLVTRHLNGDPQDNRPANLTYGTQSENVRDQLRHGTHFLAKRTHCIAGHLFTEDSYFVRPGHGRNCRICIRERQRQRRSRSAAA